MGETKMILLLTTMVAMAKTDPLVTHLESRSYRQNGKILVVSKDSVLLSRLDKSEVPHETLPKLGDVDKEIARLQNKHGTTCIIGIEPQAKDIASPVEGISITELGTCTIDEAIRYSIKDNGRLWTVVDHRGDEVSVQAFANVCEDLPLLLRLEHEKQISHRNGKALEWGATALAVGGLFTMGNPDPGFSAREQNRFWTGVFLFGSASILYTQRDTPFVYMTDKQSDLSNYHSREAVERILLKTFGLPETEGNVEETETTISAPIPSEDEAESTDANNSEAKDTESSDTSTENIDTVDIPSTVQDSPDESNIPINSDDDTTDAIPEAPGTSSSPIEPTTQPQDPSEDKEDAP